MSKKGAFIYQQIEQTTAEWATDTTVYPASVWLFERLATGKFNMKLADGVRPFSQLGAVMQDVTVAVKTNNAATYILTITTAAGSFDTPNLKPAVYTHPTFPARSAGLYKITVNAEGHVIDVIAVTKADITTLGIPAQDTIYNDNAIRTQLSDIEAIARGKSRAKVFDTVAALDTWLAVAANKATLQIGDNFYIKALNVPDYWWDGGAKQPIEGEKVDLTDYVRKEAGKGLFSGSYNDLSGRPTIPTIPGVATAAANGLMSKDDKVRLDFFAGRNDITTLVSLPVTKRTINATLTAATSLSLNGSLAEGAELLIRCIPSVAFTQPIPNTGVWTSMSGVSLAAIAGKPFEISIWSYKAGYYSIAIKEQD